MTTESLADGAPFVARPTIRGTRHMVSAGHYLAAQAGLQVLEAGGNAVDAGVAAGIALSVVQSDFVNFAGVAPIMIYAAAERKVVTIDGLGTWPAEASVDLFIEKHGGAIPHGLLRTVVPGAPAAWIMALDKYGTISFGDAAAAAIRFARDGFPMHPLMAEIIARYEENYRRWPSSAAVYLPGGRRTPVGEIFRQEDLASTLQYMTDEERVAGGGRRAGLEAARAAFYRGDIASVVAGYHEDNGGLLRLADLANYTCRIEEPIRIRFRDADVFGCGPWCQGPMLLQTLRILDALPLEELGHNTARYVHVLTEAMKLAMADREAFFGDPLFVEVPVGTLLSEQYIEERRKLIRDGETAPGLPPPGLKSTPIEPVRRAAAPEPALDTSYVAVVDREGNAFSATPSDVSIDTPVIPGTGLCPSSRGSQSWAVRGHPSAIAPGKRPRLTPNPALAIRDDGTLIPFGTPGGDVQCQAMVQALINHLVFDMDVQAAVEAPRFATYSAPDSFEPHQAEPGKIMIEGRAPHALLGELESRGHRPGLWPDWTWRAGGVCMIAADPNTGIKSGGADPRRPSYVAGW